MSGFGKTFGDEVIAAGLGGLPFSWGDDGDISGRENLTAEQNAALDAVIAAHDPTADPVDDEISDRQFFQQMAIEGRITQQEALDAVGSGVIPAAMDALVEQLPENQRFAARMLIRGATTFRRTHPVTELIGQLYGMTAEQIDTTWRNAAKL